MREEAATSTQSITSIYRASSSSLVTDKNAAAVMPTYTSVSRGLYRRRHKLLPQLPQSRSEIHIPEIYSNTATGEKFLMYTSEGNELIIFCTPSNMKRLCQANVITMDGTFDAAPKLYMQLFTIHVFESEKLLPMVYCFMSSKTSAAYGQMFQVMKDEALKQNMVMAPNTIISDFESGIISAVRQSFPNAVHQGCHFHYTQVYLVVFLFSS
jgi:hypothetical protein